MTTCYDSATDAQLVAADLLSLPPGSDKDRLLPLQRLLRIGLPRAAAEKLIARGLASAAAIAAVPAARFKAEQADLFFSTEVAARVHAAAVRRDDHARRHYLALKSATASHSRRLPLPSAGQVGSSVGSLPGYEDLFGPQDYVEVPPGRSVLSPAAYLVDLLRLKDKFVTEDQKGGGLFDRRPELKHLLLDRADTETPLPQPALAAFLLESLLSGAAPAGKLDVDAVLRGSLWKPPAGVYQQLAKAVYPPKAPFDLEYEQSLLHFDALGVSRAALYETYAPQARADALARERLRISPGRWAGMTQCAVDDQAVAARYGATSLAVLATMPAFLAGTGLSAKDVEDLLPPDPCAWINGDAGGAWLAVSGPAGKPEQQKLVLRKNGAPDAAPNARTFGRIAAFVRLAATLDWPFPELDWALRSACNGTPSGVVLARLAAWKRRWPLSIQQLCGIWSDLEPGVFDAVFNARGTDLHPFDQAWDPTAADSEKWASWLRDGLRLSQEDLLAAVKACGLPGKVQLTLPNLSKLYGLALAPRLLGLTMDGVVRLLDGGSLRDSDQFEVLERRAARLAAAGMAPGDLRMLPLASPDGESLGAYRLGAVEDLWTQAKASADLQPALAELASAPPWLVKAVLDVLAHDWGKSLAERLAKAKDANEAASFLDDFARHVALARLMDLQPSEVTLMGKCRSVDDLLDLLDYRRLKKKWHDQEGVLAAGLAASVDPLAGIWRLTGWDAKEGASLVEAWRPEETRRIAVLVRLENAFDLAALTGQKPSTLLEAASAIEKGEGAIDLSGALAAKHPDAWPQLRDKMTAGLAEMRRDALAAAALASKGLRDLDALYEHLLIDVETRGVVETSLVASGISAAQLYLERCRLGLEPDASFTPANREAFERLWPWMKSYRTWEANRQVFLYPENYVLPDARRGATAEFRGLQEALRQTDLSDSAVQQAFRDYVDDFAEVAALRTTGCYVYDDGPKDAASQLPLKRTAVLIGVTRSRPWRHYHRFVTFSLDAQTGDYTRPVWQPWQLIDIQIKAREAVPVFAFGRIFLLWVEALAADTTDITNDGNNSALVNAKVNRTRSVQVSLYLSSYDLNGRWHQPQALGKPQAMDPATWEALKDQRPLQAYAAPADIAVPPSVQGECVVALCALDAKNEKAYAICFQQDLEAIELTSRPAPPAIQVGALLVEEHMLKIHQRETTNCFKHSYSLDKKSFKDGSFAGKEGDPPLKASTQPQWTYDKENVADGALHVGAGLNLTFPGLLDGIQEAGYVVARIRALQGKNGGFQLGATDLKVFGRQGRTQVITSQQGFIAGGSISMETAEVDLKTSIRLADIDTKWHRVAIGIEAYIGGSFVAYFDGHESTADMAQHLGGGRSKLPTTLGLNDVEISDFAVMSKFDADPEFMKALTADQGAADIIVLGSLPPASELITCGNRPDWGVLDTGDEQLFVRVTRSGTSAELWRLGSSIADALSRRLRAGGVDALLSLDSQRIKERSFDGYQPKPAAQPRSPKDAIDWRGPGGSCFWELFFHAPRLIASLLNARQKFPEAKAMLERVFDPKARPALRFDGLAGGESSLEEAMADPAALAVYENDPFDPHALALLRPVAYEKAVFADYTGNLLDWADSLFREYTRESLAEAELLYVLANHLLGRRPLRAGLADLPPATSYDKLVELGDFLVHLENTPAALWAAGGPGPAAPAASATSAYFGIPENDAFIAIHDRVDDRLRKLRAGLNIDGVAQPLPLFEPALDPTALVRELAAGGEGQDGGRQTVPLPFYRFTVLVEKTKSCVAQVCELGDALLGVLEKKDAAALERLVATQEGEILGLSVDIKRMQIDAASRVCTQLEAARAAAQRRRLYYASALAAGPSILESSQLDNIRAAQALCLAAGVSHTVASGLRLVPQAGSPFAMTWGGEQLGPATEALGGLFSLLADNHRMSGDLDGIQAGFERRAQEWQLQCDLAQDELDQLDAQAEAARLSYACAVTDYGLLQRQIVHSNQRDAFLRSRFTSQELYEWKAARLAGFFADAYRAAYGLVLQCEKALQFELGLNDTFVSGGWDDRRRGLLSGERLRAALLAMETAYLTSARPRLQIQKTLCLSTLGKLDDLKNTGTCKFDITAQMLDADFTGHRQRRIESVAITIPALLAPYQNVRALLTQTGNEVEMADSSRRKDFRTGEQVVLSRGLNDSGVLEPLTDGRYAPFEGTGAVSQWELQILDTELRKDLSEVVFVMNYSALNA